LKHPPQRVSLPDYPSPTTRALANKYYPRAIDIADTARRMLGIKSAKPAQNAEEIVPLDIPDNSFKGPF